MALLYGMISFDDIIYNKSTDKFEQIKQTIIWGDEYSYDLVIIYV